MLNMCEQRLSKEEVNKYSKERIKIVEGGGIKMSNILVQKNPFPSQNVRRRPALFAPQT